MATQVRDTAQVLDHHLEALGAGRLDDIVSDYADDALLMVPSEAIKGKAAIRAAFEGYLAGLFKPGTYRFTMDTRRVEGDVGYFIWHTTGDGADVVYGTDTFIVRGGQIQVQTFAAKVETH